eukprot:TRINITY_DN4960_c0_g1_i1.p1 TRINITY_DN4960_c0_g1~~TRINITY_DN4960_c0_g1_i1.p1  ORF type:complete len:196 (-),score=42.03 TRINITY_DN4960_c0_g1_i1:627-1214(-)
MEKIKRVFEVYASVAMGPARGHFWHKILGELNSYWNDGHRICEAISLTDNQCILDIHDDSTKHSSGVVYTHACNCGEEIGTRQDPFDLDEANNKFYRFCENCEEEIPIKKIPNRGRKIGNCDDFYFSSIGFTGNLNIEQQGFVVSNSLSRWEINLAPNAKADISKTNANRKGTMNLGEYMMMKAISEKNHRVRYF